MSKGSERVKAWRRRHPERARAAQFKANHGIDLKDLPNQKPKDGRCQLCGNKPKGTLHWDHSHCLKEFEFGIAEYHRGWLCFRCNYSLIGSVEAVGLINVIQYLIRTPAGRSGMLRYLQKLWG